jgi:hypothetical protein
MKNSTKVDAKINNVTVNVTKPTILTTVVKEVKEVSRLSKVSKDAKMLQKSLGACRSFLIENSTALELTSFEVKFLNDTKKDQQKYELLKSKIQFVKETNNTCVYWIMRTLIKLEKESNKK